VAVSALSVGAAGTDEILGATVSVAAGVADCFCLLFRLW